MNMRQMTMLTVSMLMVTAAFAAGAKKKTVQAMVGNDDGPETSGRDAKVLIDQMPKTGQACTLPAPFVNGATQIGICYTKPRRWIVIETKYTTFAKFLDQLTFNWHVLLDAKKAKENKGNRLGIPQYSYFNTTVTYFNIPQGSHAACVCLPPSYYELYGEPLAIGFTISNQNGDILAGGTVSEVPGIKTDAQFWDDQKIMGATDAAGKPLIERRQGLVDRSKTIWAIVNSNDYEATLQ